MKQRIHSTSALAVSITRAASQQTYSTIRFLVDRDRVSNAYQAYAYFRWVDDRLDQGALQRPERLAFIARQAALVNNCYRGAPPRQLNREEQMLAELVASDSEQNGGLQSYIRNLMAVMVFDAERRGRLVSQAELNEYSRWLATAVTEAMHYFIGHDCRSPQSETRYLAVTAAHITHMLRDTFADLEAGYYNIPREYLEAHRMTPCAVKSEGYQLWVQSRVQLARAYFNAGQTYLRQVENPRCRLAGYAYLIRFEGVLDAIERENYQLRSAYAEREHPGAMLKAIRLAFEPIFGQRLPQRAPHAVSARYGSQREL